MANVSFSGAVISKQQLDTPLESEGLTITSASVLAENLTGTMSIDSRFVSYNILTNATLTATSSATIIMAKLQNIVVDYVVGSVVSSTVTAGSIQINVMGVEPQSGLQTSTLLAGPWYAGQQQAGGRLALRAPLGYEKLRPFETLRSDRGDAFIIVPPVIYIPWPA